jgi:hypothetical protein
MSQKRSSEPKRDPDKNETDEPQQQATSTAPQKLKCHAYIEFWEKFSGVTRLATWLRKQNSKLGMPQITELRCLLETNPDE